jgi:hypothetical protein
MNPDAAAAIRRAFACGEFAKALKLWNAYAEELQRAIAGGDAAAALAEAGQLVEWARLQGKCMRAHAAAQLNEARVASRYASGAPSPRKHFLTTL